MNKTQFVPQYMQKWEDPGSYMGPDWSEYYIACSHTRDSGPLEESNWYAISSRLQQYTELTEGSDIAYDKHNAPLIIVRASHWAVGWVEFIGIHEDASDLLMIAEDMRKAMQNYPVLDDDDYYQREYDRAMETWKSMSTGDRIIYLREYGYNKSSLTDLLECVRGDSLAAVEDYSMLAE